MKITVHRGAAEIGGTCIEIEENGARIILDLGLPLNSELEPEQTLPSVKGLFRHSPESSNILGVIISHPHQDHYGLITHIIPEIPVYTTESGRVLMEMGELLSGSKAELNWKVFKPFEQFSVGHFLIHPFLVDHSAFEACALMIESQHKRLFYSGDFRAHGRKGKLFEHFILNPPQKIDALLMEGTMLGRSVERVRSETELEDDFYHVIRNSSGLVLCTMSSQNIDRLVTLYKAAIRSGRIVVLDFFTAITLDRLKTFAQIPHLSSGFQNLRVWYPFFLSKRIVETSGKEALYPFRPWKVTREEIALNPTKYVLLTKASYFSDIEKIGFTGGDYVYSQWQGYFRESRQQKFNALLQKRKTNFHHIHTSGHAPQDDLKRFVQAIAPQQLIPIHTENPEGFRELYHCVASIHDGIAFMI